MRPARGSNAARETFLRLMRPPKNFEFETPDLMLSFYVPCVPKIATLQTELRFGRSILTAL